MRKLKTKKLLPSMKWKVLNVNHFAAVCVCVCGGGGGGGGGGVGGEAAHSS